MAQLLSRVKRHLPYMAYHGLTHLRRFTKSPNELTDLANKYDSDKGDLARGKHNYTRIYLEYFRELRDQPVELLEIGLYHPAAKKLPPGAPGSGYDRTPSLFMWLDFFRKGNITGFDIDDFSSVKRDRLRIVRGDQSKREDLAKLALPGGKQYDIIIEDGSHASHHQQISLGFLFKYLKPGGLFFLEDLAWQPEEYEPRGATKTVEVLEKLKYFGEANSAYFLPEEKAYLEEHVAKISLFDSCSPGVLADSLAVLVKK